MKSKKLTLDQIKVKSFITGMSNKMGETAKGGKQNVTFECSAGCDTEARCDSSEPGCVRTLA